MIFLNLLRLLRTSFNILCGSRQSRAILSANLATASTFTAVKGNLVLKFRNDLSIYPAIYTPPHSHLLHRIHFTLAPPLSSSSSSRATVAGVHRRRRRTATCLLFVPLFWYACSSVVPQLFLPQYCCVLFFLSSTVLLETHSYASFTCFPQPIPHERI